MATLVTKTIKSSGGDYSTVTAWEAGEQGDLVAADEVRQGVCYDFNETGSVTINGSTTDATRYLELTVVTAARHAGVYSATAGKFYWTRSNQATACLEIADASTHVSYIQFKHTNATDGQIIQIASGGSGSVIENCIGAGCAGAGTGNSGVNLASSQTGIVIRNCIFYGGHNGVYVGFNATATVDNCTLVANRSSGMASHAACGAVVVRNTYSGGNAGDDYVQGTDTTPADWTFTTCMSSDAVARTGVTASVAHTTANFANVTATTENYHLVLGSALINAGTDLSGSFTVDIDGATRVGTWDIGADSFQSGHGAAGSQRSARSRPWRVGVLEYA